MKGKQHANVPYLWETSESSSEVSHTRCFRFVVIHVTEKDEGNGNAGRSAHNKKEKKKRLITNVNAIHLPFRQKAVDYVSYEFVDFGGREYERAEKDPNKAFDARVCCCALCCTLFTSDIFRGSQWQ